MDTTLAKKLVDWALQRGLPVDTSDAQALLKVWLDNRPGTTRDRYGNYTYTDKKGEPRRYHFAPKVLQNQIQTDHGYRKDWSNISSTTYIAAALNVLGNAALDLGEEGKEVRAAVEAVVGKRADAKAERERKAEEKERIAQARVWAVKRVAFEHWDRMFTHTLGSAPIVNEEASDYEQRIQTYQDDFLERGLPVSDGMTPTGKAYASTSKPPLPVFMTESVKYIWAEPIKETGGVATLRMAKDKDRTEYVNVRIGALGGSGLDSLPASGRIELASDDNVLGQGALGGTLDVDRVEHKIFAHLRYQFFQDHNAHSQAALDGATTNLALWCQLLRGYRVNNFVMPAEDINTFGDVLNNVISLGYAKSWQEVPGLQLIIVVAL